MKKNTNPIKSDKTIKDNANTYVLKGNITIQQTETLKNELLSTIKKMNSIYISGKNIEDIDVTFIQLMYSLKSSMTKQNKQINYDIELPEELTELLDNTGFKSLNENLNK